MCNLYNAILVSHVYSVVTTREINYKPIFFPILLFKMALNDLNENHKSSSNLTLKKF